MYECGEFALSVWNVMAEAQQALIVPVQFNECDV